MPVAARPGGQNSATDGGGRSNGQLKAPMAADISQALAACAAAQLDA